MTYTENEKKIQTKKKQQHRKTLEKKNLHTFWKFEEDARNKES